MDRVTVTITDADEAPIPVVEIGFDPVSYVVDEASGTVELRVNVLSGVLTETITLSYVVSDVSTTVSEDYTVTLDMLMLSLETPSVTIKVAILDDDLDEVDEMFTVTLSGGSSGVLLTASVATVTILDDDVPTLSLELSSESVIEGAGVTVSAVLSSSYTDTVEVLFEVVGGSAEFADYSTPSSLRVTIPVGATRASFVLTATADLMYEATDETLTLRLSLLSGGVRLTGAVQTLTIIDDGPVPTVSLELSSASVVEGVGVTVSAELSVVYASEVEVLLEIVGGSAEFADYLTPSTLRATLPAGSTSVAYVLTATVDGLYEGLAAETLELRVRVFGTGGLISSSVETLEIEDVDKVTIGFQETTYRKAEGENAVLRVAVLVGTLAPGVELSLNYETLDDSAYASSDYTATVGTLLLNSVSTGQDIIVPLIDDEISEVEERLTVELTAVITSDPRVTVAPSVSEILIGDNDPVAGFRIVPIMAVTEGETLTVEVVLDSVSASTVTVTLEDALSGTANSGVDYSLPGMLTATIAVGDLTATFRIATLSDELYEGSETLDLRASTDVVPGIVEGRATILDEDVAPRVRFERTTSTVAEGSSVSILVVLEGALIETDVEVEFTVSGTAVEVTDYVLLSRSVTILSGEATGTIELETLDDSVYGGGVSETVVLVLTGASGGVRLGESVTHTVTIIDDELAPVVELPVVVTVTLRLSSVTVSEGSSETLYIDLSEATSEDVTVTLTVSGTATDGADYELLPSAPYVLTAGETELAVGISTVIDGIYEGDETLEFVISTLSGPAVTGSVDRVTVTITDADEAPVVELPVVVTVTLRVSSETVAEGSSETLYIVLTEATSEDVTVTLAVAGTATDGADYELLPSAPYVLTAGETELAVGISTVIDGLYEGDETLEFVISTLSGPAVTGAVDRVTVTITDADEAPVPAVEVGFDPVTYRVGEGSGTVELRVSVLSGDLTETISLNYATSDGSAVAGDDYALTTGTLTLSSGATSFTFTVKILEDLDNVDVELAGVFSVALSVVDVLPAGVSLTSSVATVMIIDNDQPTMPDAVTATLSLARVTLLEGEIATVEIRLTGNAPEDLTFTLELDSVSGEVTNSDYTLTPIVALIPSGANRATVSIFAVNDSDPEAVESFTLRLESISTRVAIGTTGSITVTITENDQPAGITVTPITPVTEGDQIIVEVVLDAVSSDTVTVILVDAFTGSAEAGGVDYTLPVRLSEQITIGETRAIFRISTTLNDFLYEGDETVDLEFSVMGSSSVVPATALIRDADQAPTVSFAASQPTTVIEGSSVGILVRLDDAQLVSDLTVEFEVGLASTATSADYVVGSSVVIAAGEPFVMLTLTAASDRVYDGGVRETVELRLTGVSGGRLPGITLGSRTTHAVSIIDAQLPPLVSFAASQPTTVAEGSSVEILVELDGALTDDAVVVDFTVSGTADEGVDYDSPGTRVTILPGEVTALISLVARADNRYDGGMTETVELVLTAASGGVILSDSMTHAVTIIDNELAPVVELPVVVTVTLRVSSETVAEGSSETLYIVLTEVTSEDVTVTLAVAGTATDGADYELLPSAPYVLTAGETELAVGISTVIDGLYEGDETLEFVISTLSGPAVTGLWTA